MEELHLKFRTLTRRLGLNHLYMLDGRKELKEERIEQTKETRNPELCVLFAPLPVLPAHGKT